MRAKKYVIAIAIFGGMLFTAQAANMFQVDGQQTTKIEKNRIKAPRQL